MTDKAHLDPQSLEQVVATLLTKYPEAPIAAIDRTGNFVRMPASVPVLGHPVLVAYSALDLVAGSDRSRVIEAWTRVGMRGVARAIVRLADGRGPGLDAVVHFVDARRLYGVYLGFLLANPGSRPPTEPADGSVRPRVTVVHRDELGFVTEVDGDTAAMLGWGLRQLSGQRPLDLIHPEDNEGNLKNWMDMLAAPGSRSRWRGRHIRRDGSWLWVEITNHNLLEDPDFGYVSSQMVDISEEVALQEALNGQEQLLHGMAETLSVGVLQFDSERRVIYANDKLRQVAGTGPCLRVDEQLSTVLLEDRLILTDAIDAALAEGVDADFEMRLLHHQASPTRYCVVTLRAVTGGPGPAAGAIMTIADVTDSAHIRAELAHRATYDSLTRCQNRQSIMATVESAFDSQPGPVGLVCVHLDGLGAIKDRLGDTACDQLMALAAGRLRRVVRSCDVVARLSDDEFLLVCPGVRGTDQIMIVADRAATALNQEVVLGATRVTMRTSIGASWTGTDATDVDHLVAAAQAAMHDSELNGGQPVLFDNRFDSRIDSPSADQAMTGAG